MPKRNWVDGATGNTPLNGARLNALETDVDAGYTDLVRDPSQLFTGAITRNSSGAPTSATVTWPDGVAGVYAGTASSTFPSAIDSYTVTRAVSPTLTYTQSAVTRDGSGNITNRPPITVA